MNWSRLIQNKCPKCAARTELTDRITLGYLRCLKCDFTINLVKFKTICARIAERNLTKQ